MLELAPPMLPKSDDDLALIMRSHADRERYRMAARQLRWSLASLYLAGERRFELRTPWGSFLRMEEMESSQNTVPMHVSHLVSEHNKIIGNLNGLDLRPLVARDDTTLAAIRDRSTTQVILDAAVSGQHVDLTKRLFLHYFTLLGSAGLHSQVGDFPHVGLTGEMETVHPREIYPWPAIGGDLAKVRGRMRDRWIPWTAVKDTFGLKSMPTGGQELEVTKRQPGEGDYIGWSIYNNNMGMDSGGFWQPIETRTTGLWGRKDGERPEELWVRVKELWLDGPRGTCREYAASSGKYIFARETYDQVQAYCPLSIRRFYECGDFYGAGVFDLIFSMVREFEKLIRDLVANVREIDQYSTMILPAGTMDEKKFFSHNRQNLRVLSIDPEPKGVYGTQAQVVRPTIVTPPNSGDMPGRTASFLLNVIKDLSPIRDIIADKGRVDSFAGLQFLQDEAQRPVANPISSLVEVFGESYRYIASQAFNILQDSPRPIAVGRLSIDLVGAVIDPETSTLSFSGGVNRPPDIGKLRFTVRQTNLKMLAARKSEAVQMMQLGVTDRTGFLINAVQEGLDYACYMDGERAAYDSIVTQIITLYNDGEQPGQVIMARYLENPELQLRVLNAFLQSPKMRIASPDVIDAFANYQETLIGYSGRVMPQQVPDVYTQVAAQAASKSKPGIVPGKATRGALPQLPSAQMSK